ncbi:MAG: phosphoribosylanthranilate isomerase [Acetobacteraceae bacterium]
MEVKICGLNDPAGFLAAVEAGADWVGFVFFPRSPRAVSPAQAAALSALHPGGPKGSPGRVGLFVDPDDAALDAALGALRLDALQLYAPAARIADIAARLAMPVWRAVGVSGPADLPAAAGAETRLVIEPRPPAGASRPGGNAVRLDWTLTRGWAAPRPWLLAGGLTPDSVGRAIAESGARAVDVSSGVESAPGVKDPARIRAFVAAARAAG